MTNFLIGSSFRIARTPADQVCLEEILNLLKARVDMRYMPRARNSVHFKEHPLFTDRAHHVYDNFPMIIERARSQLCSFHNGVHLGDVYLHMNVDPIQFMINLRTHQALIRTQPDSADLYWFNSSLESVVMDRKALAAQLDSCLYFFV